MIRIIFLIQTLGNGEGGGGFDPVVDQFRVTCLNFEPNLLIHFFGRWIVSLILCAFVCLSIFFHKNFGSFL